MTDPTPITVAALAVLKLDDDRLPATRAELAALASANTTAADWTWDHVAAYRHLWALIPPSPSKKKAAPLPDDTGTQSGVCQLA